MWKMLGLRPVLEALADKKGRVTLSKSDLAGMLGVKEQSVGRYLRELRRMGVASEEDSLVTIDLDRARALEKILTDNIDLESLEYIIERAHSKGVIKVREYTVTDLDTVIKVLHIPPSDEAVAKIESLLSDGYSGILVVAPRYLEPDVEIVLTNLFGGRRVTVKALPKAKVILVEEANSLV